MKTHVLQALTQFEFQSYDCVVIVRLFLQNVKLDTVTEETIASLFSFITPNMHQTKFVNFYLKAYKSPSIYMYVRFINFASNFLPNLRSLMCNNVVYLFFIHILLPFSFLF